MHPEVAQFLVKRCEIDWTDATVFEVGSLDVNGQARDYVPRTWTRWVGFDLVEGPGVDYVGDAAKLLRKVGRCDVMVSTEVLEHDPNWGQLLKTMCKVTRPKGWMLLTCAGKGREPHAAYGSDGGPLEGEHYRNVGLHEVEAVCAKHGFTQVYGEEGPPGDTRYLGRKHSHLLRRTAGRVKRKLYAVSRKLGLRKA